LISITLSTELQILKLLEAWRILRIGVPIQKHSRKGKPGPKTLWCDINMTKLYWRNSGSFIDLDMDNEEEDFERYPSLKPNSDDQSTPSKSKKKRNSFTSLFGFRTSSGKSHTGPSFLPVKNDQDRMFYLRDALKVLYTFLVRWLIV